MPSERSLPLLPTMLVGSYPQPGWLIDRDQLAHGTVPRVRAEELWRIDPAYLAEAQDDATLLALADQREAGVDILTDGEIRRESYSNRFATALEGIDIEHPGTALGRTGRPSTVPRITGPIRRIRPVELWDLQFALAHADRPVKITVPGPFTMAAQAQNDYYPDVRAAALDYAAAVNEEIADLFEAGADYVQIDEPYMESSPDLAREFGVEVLNAALAGIAGQTIVHLCFGYAALVKDRPAAYHFLAELADADVGAISIETAQSGLDCSVLAELKNKQIVLGVIDLGTDEIESPTKVADRIRRALDYVEPADLLVAPDCGMKYLSRPVAFGKLQAMVAGAELVRGELGGS